MKEIKFITPQFKRSKPIEDKYIPKSEEEFIKFMKKSDSKRLIEVGFLIFDTQCIKDKRYGLFLFPGEWYDYIPNGFKITSISMNPITFINGQSDDDTRFGCLPYGVIKKK